MKKILSFFLLLSSFLIPKFAFALDLVPRETQIVNNALTDHAYTAMRAPVVTNGIVSTVVDQQLVVDGSSAILSQPVSFAADYAAVARSAAGLATKVAGGYAAVAAAQFALQKLLDGVGYVMHEGAVVMPNQQASLASCQTGFALVNNSSYGGLGQLKSCTVTSPDSVSFQIYYAGNGTTSTFTYSKVDPSDPNVPAYIPQTQQQVQDAFYNYLINHPTNITDPIVQKMYTPAQTSGWNLTGAEGVHYGNDGITDEIAKNIIDNRNAALQQPKSYTLNDSAQTATQVAPDGAAETNTTNPDGSKTKKTTVTTTDPNTGKQTTTTTTVVTQPDGTTQTSTQTTTTDATKTKTDIPPACDYFSTLCDWIGWTKQEPDLQDTQLDIQDKTIDDYAYADHVVFGKTCPFQTPETVTLNLGIIGQITFQKDLTFMCTFADSARPYVIGLGYLGSFLYLLIALRNRNV